MFYVNLHEDLNNSRPDLVTVDTYRAGEGPVRDNVYKTNLGEFGTFLEAETRGKAEARKRGCGFEARVSLSDLDG